MDQTGRITPKDAAMHEVTVFIGLNKGLFDPDLEPLIYDGHLDQEKITSIARMLGDVDNGTLSYNSVAVGGNPNDGFIITYHKRADASPTTHPDGGHHFIDIDSGNISFRVTHTYIHQPI